MVCIHCVSVLEYLLVLVVAAVIGRHLVNGLGLASEGVVLVKCPGWFPCGVEGLGSSQHR